MILLLDIILFARLLLLPPDQALTGRRCVGICLVQAVGFSLFKPSIALAAGFLLLTGFSLWILLTDRHASRDRINRNRVISLAAIIVLLNVLFSPVINIQPGVISSAAGAIATNLLALFSRNWVSGWELGVYLAGLFLVIGEANYFIRWILGKFHFTVENEKDNIDQNEFNAGKIIGIIERLLIYQFMLLGAYSTIGFVLAAKGFTRFRELDKRAFAEYVLVGTLLSTACAVFIALAVGLMMNI